MLRYLFSLLLLLPLCILGVSGQYQVGVGIGDITGPITEITFMGYADWGQVGRGILQRVYARAFIIHDLESHKRMVFVNTDTQSMGDIVKKRVVQRLGEIYGDLYTIENIMLSSTHTHSSVGGYLQYTLFAFSVKGWIEETTEPMVQGIVRSIVQAHEKLQDGYVTFNEGELMNANINRSPLAYLLNPAEERAEYKYDVDKTMTLLGLHSAQGMDLGLINWFAVHGVSVNNTNHLVNGDNKGYAAYAAEKRMNPDSLPGKGPFVAGFAQANEGDVSPNTEGAFCGETDISCDGSFDTKCPNSLRCFGRGPGWKISDYESNKIIGERQADMALKLYNQASKRVQGPVDFRQKYWDITKETIILPDGSETMPCLPAIGYAFGAGTTDGPAMKGLYQNMTHGTFLWDTLRNIIKRPSKQQRECHAPKAILLNTGEMTLPYAWQPKILDIQLLRIGNVYIAGVPAEFTTMSGRRLRRAIKAKLIEHGAGDNDTQVILSGPANGYASYVTTHEEYQMQRFEGGGTAYGPHTLQAYINVFEELATAMATGQPVGPSEELPDYTSKAFNFAPPLRSDGLKPFHRFGQVVRDVDRSVAAAKKGVISATFVAGNPRNNPMLQGTFLTIEKRLEDGTWKVVRTDDDYDTRFRWKYTNTIMAYSEATVEWDIDEETPAGIYRIGYFGHNREFFSRKIVPHQGYSSEFEIPAATTHQQQYQSPFSTQCTQHHMLHPGITPFQHVFPFFLLH